MKVQTTFQNLLNVERDNCIEMFPQFKKLRSAPEMFEETPVETETYMEGGNCDCTLAQVLSQLAGDKIITIQKKAIKASQRIESRLVDGVVQRHRTRAFVEYHGPDRSFKWRLSDTGDAESVDDKVRTYMAVCVTCV
jgi:hypothetical protein